MSKLIELNEAINIHRSCALNRASNSFLTPDAYEYNCKEFLAGLPPDIANVLEQSITLGNDSLRTKLGISIGEANILTQVYCSGRFPYKSKTSVERMSGDEFFEWVRSKLSK